MHNRKIVLSFQRKVLNPVCDPIYTSKSSVGTKENYVDVMKREKLSGEQGQDSSILGYESCRRSDATLVLTP
jgi:hypothetical protein